MEIINNFKRSLSEAWDPTIPFGDKPFRVLKTDGRGNPLAKSLIRILIVNTKNNEVILKNYNVLPYNNPLEPQWEIYNMTYDDFKKKYKGAGVNSIRNKYTYQVGSLSYYPESIETLIRIYQVISAGDSISFKMTKPVDSVVINSETGKSKIQLDDILFSPRHTTLGNPIYSWPNEVTGFSTALDKKIVFKTWDLEGFIF